MALMGDIFAENLLDEPDDLERIEENEVLVSGAEEENSNNEEEEKKNDDANKGKKKRKLSTRPKLNILRLMSEKNGLTTLEQVFKDVKFKGKGYEREDLDLIMRKMEIWTHKLFPSMQFDDCLAKLEKLGNTKSVTTYVKKIRLDMAVPRVGDVIEEQDDSDNELQPQSSISEFDKLLNSQNRTAETQINNNTGVSTGLTTEQRERMIKNRLIAEQRRLARMKAREEQQMIKETENDSMINVNEVQEDSISMQSTAKLNDTDVNFVETSAKVIKGIEDNMEISICDSTAVNFEDKTANNAADLTTETDNNMEVTICDSIAAKALNAECKTTKNTVEFMEETKCNTEAIVCDSTAANTSNTEIANNREVNVCDSTATINPDDEIAESGLSIGIEDNIEITNDDSTVTNNPESGLAIEVEDIDVSGSIVNNEEITSSDSKQ